MNKLLRAMPMLAALAAFTASAVEVVTLPEPIKSPLKANTVVCNSPESLFLLYESTRIAKGTDPAARREDTRFFDGMFAAAQKSGACTLQGSAANVEITNLTFIANDWQQPHAVMVYGQFFHPAQKRVMSAPLMALPGLGNYMQHLSAQAAQTNGQQAK